MASPNHDPIFVSRPIHWDAQLSNQVVNRLGGSQGAAVLLGTADECGGTVTSIAIEVTGNTDAGNVCVLYSQRDGQTLRKRAEVTLPQVGDESPNQAIANYPIHFTLPDREPFEAGTVNLLKLEPKESLYVGLLATETTSKFLVHAVGGLYDQI